MTLAQAILRLARILFDVAEGTATDGSGTTLVDTTRTEPADYFDGGTIWFLSGDNSGKTAIISDWNLSTKTFTFLAPGANIVAGVLYAACPKDWPRYMLRQSINSALETMGTLPQRNTALVTVADQEAYDLPAGVYNIKRVEVATAKVAPLEYQVHHNWVEINDDLVFDTGRAPSLAGYTIRLTHTPRPTELTTDAATISDVIHPDRLSWEAAVHALRWRVQRTREDEPDKVRQLNEALANALREAHRHPIPKQPRDPHLAGW